MAHYRYLLTTMPMEGGGGGGGVFDSTKHWKSLAAKSNRIVTGD